MGVFILRICFNLLFTGSKCSSTFQCSIGCLLGIGNTCFNIFNRTKGEI